MILNSAEESSMYNKMCKKLSWKVEIYIEEDKLLNKS